LEALLLIAGIVVFVLFGVMLFWCVRKIRQLQASANVLEHDSCPCEVQGVEGLLARAELLAERANEVLNDPNRQLRIRLSVAIYTERLLEYRLRMVYKALETASSALRQKRQDLLGGETAQEQGEEIVAWHEAKEDHLQGVFNSMAALHATALNKVGQVRRKLEAAGG